ncbi:MAG TPA: glutaredoxin family protein [Gallionellaceae bacterium]
MKKIALLLAGCFVLAAHADSLYRWVDSAGHVHYGDRPESQASKVEKKNFSGTSDAAEDELLPYASRVARQNFPVTMYVAENCGDLCVQARGLLNKRGIPFTEKFISTAAESKALVELAGSFAIPTLVVGRTVLKGFDASQWQNELDIAGYPKTAPYGVRPVPPSKPASAPVAASAPSDTTVPPEAAAPAP